MTKQMEINLATIYLNCLENMHNTDEDWEKVVTAYSDATHGDKDAGRRGLQYVSLLERIMAEVE